METEYVNEATKDAETETETEGSTSVWLKERIDFIHEAIRGHTLNLRL